MALKYISDQKHLNRDIKIYFTRNSDSMSVYVPKLRTEYFHNSFQVMGPQIWNSLPREIQDLKLQSNFKKAAKEFFRAT